MRGLQPAVLRDRNHLGAGGRVGELGSTTCLSLSLSLSLSLFLSLSLSRSDSRETRDELLRCLSLSKYIYIYICIYIYIYICICQDLSPSLGKGYAKRDSNRQITKTSLSSHLNVTFTYFLV